MTSFISKDHASLSKTRLNRELFITGSVIIFTGIATVFYLQFLVNSYLETTTKTLRFFIEFALYSGITLSLVYGTFVYHFCRYGYLRRLMNFEEPSSDDVNRLFYAEKGYEKTLSVLVPSYREEYRTIYQTLLSTALMEFPRKRVVLLIDNPPTPRHAAEAEELEETRKIPDKLNEELAGIRSELEATFELHKTSNASPKEALERLHQAYAQVIDWFEQKIAATPCNDHTDALFIRWILEEPKHRYLQEQRVLGDDTPILATYRRLISIFSSEITSFERKLYDNLSHEANKAMNINSYLSLMGRSYTPVRRNDGYYLKRDSQGSLVFPKTPYVLTIDADSLVLSSYAKLLIYCMEQPQWRDTAIIQTPYSAINGSPVLIERIAGLTTDIQYLIHQGFTRFHATYWVGANAIIRVAALKDIEETSRERGHLIRRYISDTTVIEDTESSIDLVRQGWQLYNYPQRLSFSATPPDYGALLIQRRRWANGGLIILPKLLRYLFRNCWRMPIKMFSMGFFRVHYLISIALVNIGIALILLYPFEISLISFWLILIGVSYFYLYYRDMRIMEYRPFDVVWAYALNLLLIPINIGGVLKSLEQAVMRKKISFARTPKVHDRTLAPKGYLLATHFIPAFSFVSLFFTWWQGFYYISAFIAFNIIIFSLSMYMMGRSYHKDVLRMMRVRLPFSSRKSSLK